MFHLLGVATLSLLVISSVASPFARPQGDTYDVQAARQPSDTPPRYPAQPTPARATVYSKCRQSNTVALTFDDGPGIYEPELLDTLAKYNAKATFFLNGNNYRCIYNQQQVDIVRRIYNAGHQIGSHTWSHPHLNDLSWQETLIRIVGVNPLLFRPPFGEYNDNVLSALKARNQSAVLWDFDNGDSVGASPAQSNKLYDEVARRHPSNLLALNHSVYNSTVRIVAPHALAVLSKQKYRFVTVSECLGLSQKYQSTKQPEQRTVSRRCRQFNFGSR
ncbi:chitin deacetylase [Auriculariales sp. MPI-PUGE-AT-0066]|nr:chitin deacetylase [Auriculariales sp. MPI-PUGE-AT-0066]